MGPPPPEVSDRVIRPPGTRAFWRMSPGHTHQPHPVHTPGHTSPTGEHTCHTDHTHSQQSQRHSPVLTHTCPSAHHSPVFTHVCPSAHHSRVLTHTPHHSRVLTHTPHHSPVLTHTPHHTRVLTHTPRHGPWLEELDLGPLAPLKCWHLESPLPPPASPTAGAAISSSLLLPTGPGLRTGGKRGWGWGRPGRTEERVCGHPWRWSTACLLP